MPLTPVKITNEQYIQTFVDGFYKTDPSFVERIPENVRENIVEVGNAILNYQPAKDAFYLSLMEKITLQRFYAASFNNKFQFLKMGATHGVIEDAFEEIAEGYKFDNQGTDALAVQSKGKTSVLYSRIDRQLQYSVTLSDSELRRAMITPYGIDDYLMKKVESLYTGKEYDEYSSVKQLLSNFQLDFKGEADTDEDGVIRGRTEKGYRVHIVKGTRGEIVDRVLYEIMKSSKDISYMSRKFSGNVHLDAPTEDYRVINNTPLDRQLIVIDKDMALDINFDKLAHVYNMNVLELKARIVEVDGFNIVEEENGNGNGEETIQPVAMVVDTKGVVWDEPLLAMETQRNAKGRFTNYFLTTFQRLSFLHFFNTVIFTVESQPEPPIE
jgi:hypothetical protein